ncbi:MAG: phosphoglycerate kinase [Candidatus Margulisiibacteriota bacterium]|nr:phosphoglycerate kinase [Candidatus Margulisiibacteriota bacterium]
MLGKVGVLNGPKIYWAANGARGGAGVYRSTFKKLSIYDLGSRIKGKRVLIRCDFNGTAKNGEIFSPTRIDAALDTIKHVMEQGASQIVLLSHNGRNKQIKAEGEGVYTLEPVAQYLTGQLGIKVDFVKGFGKPLTSQAGVVLMGNTRADARDEAKDPAANKAYAEEILATTNPDVYIIDGFSVCHRDQASVTWPAKLMKEQGKAAVAGHLLAEEYKFFIDSVVNNPQKPFLVFLGGAKVESKLPILEALLANVDQIVIGGAMAFPFMLEKGYKVEAMDPFASREGRAEELSRERVIAGRILQGINGPKVIIPTQIVGRDRTIIDIDSKDPAPEGFVMKDILATELFSGLQAVGYKTIFFNGTFGAYEEKLGGHVEGTNAVLSFMGDQTKKGAITIPGGGDTITVLKGLRKIREVSFYHETTGGGASGSLITLGFAGDPESLPGFACLTDKA